MTIVALLCLLCLVAVSVVYVAEHGIDTVDQHIFPSFHTHVLDYCQKIFEDVAKLNEQLATAKGRSFDSVHLPDFFRDLSDRGAIHCHDEREAENARQY
jgi:hypothetical protein